MKIITVALLFFLMVPGAHIAAQEVASVEKFSNTLNLRVGAGYYGYVGYSMPVLHADYEFQATSNFTLTPIITVYSYQNYYYWGNLQHPYRNYTYRETVIPIGVKGSYYFDQLLHAGPKWDFYLGASLGGEAVVPHSSSGLYPDGHIRTEYHHNQKFGLFLIFQPAYAL